MSQQTIPPGLDDLTLNFDIANWGKEKELHCTDKYFSERKKLLSAVKNRGNGNNTACCHFCGFPDGDFLELHHLDGNHENWDESNLTLACSLCHKNHHLGWVGLHNLGSLVYLPITKGQNSSKPSASHLLAYTNLYQFFKLLDTQREQPERDRLESVPLRDIFATARQLSTSFGYQELKQKNDEYLILREAYQEDARKTNQVLNSDDTEAKDKLKNKHKEIQNQPGKLEDVSASSQAQTNDRTDFGFVASTEELTQYEKELEKYKNMELTAFISSSLHLLDFVEAMAELSKKNPGDSNGDVKSPLQMFQDDQNKDMGLFVIEYNFLALKPWHSKLGYSLNDRIQYYRELGLLYSSQFTPEQEDAILRRQYMAEQARNVASDRAIGQDKIVSRNALDNIKARYLGNTQGNKLNRFVYHLLPNKSNVHR